MTTLYRATTYGNGIKKIDATRVTESGYFALDSLGKECRNALSGNNFKVFETEKEAIGWIRCEIENSIKAAQRMVEYRMNELNKFNAKYPQP